MKIYRGDSDTAKLHRLALDLIWADRPSSARTVSLYLNGLLWPILCLKNILIQLGRFGRVAAEEYGISRIRQASRMWWGAVRYGLVPAEYYKFRIFVKEDLGEAFFFVQNHEQLALLKESNRDFDTTLTADKLKFFRFCREHNLPTIPIFAILEPDGKVEFLIDLSKERHRLDENLFFKPTNLYRGFGTESFTFEGESGEWRLGADRFSFDEMCSLMHERHKGVTYLIQPHLRNAKEWLPLTSGALATVRLVTYRTIDREVGCLAARLAVPYIESSIHDHFALAMGIDVDSGEMKEFMHEIYDETTTEELVSYRPFSKHPTTGYDVSGKKLYGWESLKEVCVRGHRALPVIPFVGWDVTLAEEGPVIVEANSIWGHTSSQISQGVALGRTPYPKCYLGHYADKQGREQRSSQ